MKILYVYGDVDEHPSGRFQRSGARRLGRLLGWDLHFAITNSTLADIRRAVRSFRPDGLIIEASFCPDAFAPAAFGDVPTVYLDCSVDAWEGRIWKVVYDSEAIGRRGAQELMKSASALTDFAFVGFRRNSRWSALRATGFCGEIARAGFKPWAIASHAGETQNHYRRRLKRWIARLPTQVGIMAANDEMAAWTLQALTELGRRVPGDVLLLGVDNDEEICSKASPTLSSIRLDNERAGYVAAERLNDLLHGKRLEERTVRIDRCSIVSRRSMGNRGCVRAPVVEASDYIREHATWGISARDVVAHMGLAPRLAELRYRQMTGRSIAADIQLVRFEQLFALLRDGRRNLSVLADMCGFGGPETLRREFRRRTGMSVRDWCRRARSGGEGI